MTDTVAQVKRRTLADYRPQHDSYCQMRRVIDLSAKCTCGLDALLALHADQSSPSEVERTTLAAIRQRWVIYRSQQPRYFDSEHVHARAIERENRLIDVFVRDLDALLACSVPPSPSEGSKAFDWGDWRPCAHHPKADHEIVCFECNPDLAADQLSHSNEQLNQGISNYQQAIESLISIQRFLYSKAGQPAPSELKYTEAQLQEAVSIAIDRTIQNAREGRLDHLLHPGVVK